jgi:hypothetical protein
MNHLRNRSDLWQLHQNTATGKCVSITVKYLNQKRMIGTCLTITIWYFPTGRCLVRSVPMLLGQDIMGSDINLRSFQTNLRPPY